MATGPGGGATRGGGKGKRGGRSGRGRGDSATVKPQRPLVVTFSETVQQHSMDPDFNPDEFEGESSRGAIGLDESSGPSLADLFRKTTTTKPSKKKVQATVCFDASRALQDIL